MNKAMRQVKKGVAALLAAVMMAGGGPVMAAAFTAQAAPSSGQIPEHITIKGKEFSTSLTRLDIGPAGLTNEDSKRQTAPYMAQNLPNMR